MLYIPNESGLSFPALLTALVAAPADAGPPGVSGEKAELWPHVVEAHPAYGS